MLATARLLERETDLATLDAAIAAASAGGGRTVHFRGAAGIGKTALLAAAAARGKEAGARVLRARGTELERDLPLALIRQLLGTALDPNLQASDTAAVLHAVHWTVVRLADDMPLVLCVDDLHWADDLSVRALAYLSRRLEGVAATMVTAQRAEEPAPLVEDFAADPAVTVLEPAPLAAAAVGAIVEDAFNVPGDPAFTEACRETTGGNPLLLCTLVEAAVTAGLRPTEHSTTRLKTLAPDALRGFVTRRLHALGDAARVIAEALAVLGPEAPPRYVAHLTELDVDVVCESTDALTGAGLLADGSFAHPLLRAIVYSAIAPSRRAALHRSAALALREESAPADRVGVHLLPTSGRGEAWVVDALRAAAAGAGTPEAAVTFLRRALEEPPVAEDYPAVLGELGRAEALAQAPASSERLRQAIAVTEDSHTKAQLAFDLMSAYAQQGLIPEMAQLGTEAVAWAGGDADLHAGLEGLVVFAEVLLGTFTADRYLRLLAGVGDTRTHGVLRLKASLAHAGTFAGIPAEEIAALAADALSGGELAAGAGEDPVSFLCATFSLEFADRLEESAMWLSKALDDARKKGSPTQYMIASSARAPVNVRRGALDEAEADARVALELAETYVDYTMPTSLGALVCALVWRGDLEEADRMLARYPVDPAEAVPYDLAFYHYTMGVLRLARHAYPEALAAFTESGELMAANGVDHPAFYPWRSGAALAHSGMSQTTAAQPLAEQEVEVARAFGAPRVLGVALRTLGRVTRDLEVLAEAEAVLRRSPARLEHAAAQVELGLALRRTGKRVEARKPLGEALDVAAALHAKPLEALAREELVASGARPRRHRSTGVDALTAMELRTARLAAANHTNREIAQELFLSVKTVEKHLQGAFRKLGIDSRQKLGVLPL